MRLPTERIVIVVGHYGSGKSEFVLNLASKYRDTTNNNVTVADLDIINPYFRSREAKAFCKIRNIEIIAGSIENSLIAVPALSGAVQGKLAVSDDQLILDVAGDAEGANLLKVFNPLISKEKKMNNVQTLFIFNSNRPETSNLENSINMIKRIEESSNIEIDAIINNSHFLKATKSEDIIEGEKASKKLADAIEKPLLYTSFWNEIDFSVKDLIYSDAFPMDLLLRENWMS